MGDLGVFSVSLLPKSVLLPLCSVTFSVASDMLTDKPIIITFTHSLCYQQDWDWGCLEVIYCLY